MAPRAAIRRPLRGGFARRLALIAMCLAVVSPFGSPTGSVMALGQALETGSSCAVTERAYELTLCLTTPAPRAALTSDTLISATVEISDPDIDVRTVDFLLNGSRILSDFDAPYEFMLPVSYWGNGTYELSVSTRTSDDERTDPLTAQITIASGEPLDFPTSSFVPTTGRPANEGEPFVVAAVGDSAGGSPESASVSDLMASWNPNLLLYLGDVYNSGTYAEFMNWYDPDQYMGRFRDITLPTPGNHEYAGEDVPLGYMEYWGDPPHYYSIDTAGWHIVSVDSNSRFGEITAGTPQMDWLAKDLAESTAACTLVFFHHPPFSVGSYAEGEAEMRELWQVLAENNVTLVLTGHDHNYQRWERLGSDGQRHPAGTVPMVIGTGGQSLYRTQVDDPRVASPAMQEAGALRMELSPNGVATQFVTIDGVVRDSDVILCDQARADTSAPTSPTYVTAIREQDGTVTLHWSSAQDDTGVDHYQVYRDGVALDEVARGLYFVDAEAREVEAPVYRIVAVDKSGNTSPPSPDTLAAGEASPDVLFADTFSAGTLGRWQEIDGLAISQIPDPPGPSAWLARARGSSNAASARWRPDDGALPDFQVSTTFRILEQGENPIVFLRLRSPDGAPLMSVNVGADGKLGTFNNVTSTGSRSETLPTTGEWHELTLVLAGTESDRQIEVLLDNVVVPELSGAVDLGVGPVGELQLGDSTDGRVYDVQYDAFIVSRASQPQVATPNARAGLTTAFLPIRKCPPDDPATRQACNSPPGSSMLAGLRTPQVALPP